MSKYEIDLKPFHPYLHEMEEEIILSRLYLKWILVLLIVVSFLLSGILACLVLIVERLFV